MKRIYSTVILAAFLSSIAAAQPPNALWSRVLSGGREARCVQQTSDGGFIIAGEVRVSHYDYDFHLIKTDNDGDIIWERNYGGEESEHCYSVHQTSDRGYIMAGYRYYSSTGMQRVLVIRTNAFGDTLWTRTFGRDEENIAKAVRQTSDGGFIIVGSTVDPRVYSDAVFLIKTDAQGNTLWTRAHSAHLNLSGESVEQTDDGGFIIGGWSWGHPVQQEDAFLLKTDANGDIVWISFFHNGGVDRGYCAIQTSDGGYALCGETFDYSTGSTGPYLIKTDTNGASIWVRVLGGDNADKAFSLVESIDGGIIFAGETSSYGSRGVNAYVEKVDSAGNYLWHTAFGWNGQDQANSVSKVRDGGFILAGKTDVQGSYSMYIIRLEGSIPVPQLEIFPLNPVVVIPAGGGAFLFQARIDNFTTVPIVIDAWSEVMLPGIATFEPVRISRGMVIPSGASPGRLLTQRIPFNPPPGDYVYIGKIGIYPDSVIDIDSFPFIKMPGEGGDGSYDNWEVSGWFDDESSSSIQHSSFSILSCYPNPFNASTIISFELRDASQVKLAVYDITGREVAVLAEGMYPAGAYNVEWEGKDCASGIYFLCFENETGFVVKKAVLMK